MPRSWIVMQALIVVFVVAGIVIAIVQLASPSTGYISVAVTPTTQAEPSIATVNVVAPFTSSHGTSLSGSPSSVEIKFQQGFASTATAAVTTLCKAAAISSTGCPPASNAGHGELDVTVNGQSRHVQLLLYLGPPARSGDVASLLITEEANIHQLIDTARLLATANGGLELTTTPLSYSAQATFEKLQLVVGTSRTVKTHGRKTLRSLISNPPTCAGQWTARGTVTFSRGSYSQATVIPCG